MKNLDHEADDDLAEIQRHIGIIWMTRGKYGEALSMFEEALKIKVSLDDSTDTFHRNLMKCFEGALESVEILYGSDHLRYAKVRIDLECKHCLLLNCQPLSISSCQTTSYCTKKETYMEPKASIL